MAKFAVSNKVTLLRKAVIEAVDEEEAEELFDELEEGQIEISILEDEIDVTDADEAGGEEEEDEEEVEDREEA